MSDLDIPFREDPVAPPPPDPLLGRVVFGCRVEAVLGTGGFGTVYRAVDQASGTTVALKAMDPGKASDPGLLKRFLRGAIAAAQIEHPGVVRILRVGRDETAGLHCMAMEFVDGESLEVRLARDGPRPWREAVDLILQAAEGLSAAHARDVIHRDVKPDNLLIGRDGRVRLTDMGLARVVGSGQTTKVMGTPHFMAPEQFEGKDMDRRTDIFGLGATLYNAVSGAVPFEGGNQMQVVFAILTRPARPLAEARPDVPEAVCRIAHRMIEKKSADRYQTMDEVMADLRAVAAGG